MANNIEFSGASPITKDTFILGLNQQAPFSAKSKPQDLAHLIGDGIFAQQTDIDNLRQEISDISKQTTAFSQRIGDGRKSYTVTHHMNSDALIVQLWGSKTSPLPFYEISKVDANTIQIDFEEAIDNENVLVVIQSSSNIHEIKVESVSWDDITDIPFMTKYEMDSILREAING